jgi:hypothetical protein
MKRLLQVHTTHSIRCVNNPIKNCGPHESSSTDLKIIVAAVEDRCLFSVDRNHSLTLINPRFRVHHIAGCRVPNPKLPAGFMGFRSWNLQGGHSPGNYLCRGVSVAGMAIPCQTTSMHTFFGCHECSVNHGRCCHCIGGEGEVNKSTSVIKVPASNSFYKTAPAGATYRCIGDVAPLSDEERLKLAADYRQLRMLNPGQILWAVRQRFVASPVRRV